MNLTARLYNKIRRVIENHMPMEVRAKRAGVNIGKGNQSFSPFGVVNHI